MAFNIKYSQLLVFKIIPAESKKQTGFILVFFFKAQMRFKEIFDYLQI